MATVKIAGVTVDAGDPCALAIALEAYRLRVLTGQAVEQIDVRSPVNGRSIRFAKGGSLRELDAEIDRLKAACAEKTGAPAAPRRRRAFRVGF